MSCKYMYAGMGGFWTKEESVFYSWSKVCMQMELGKQGKLHVCAAKEIGPE